jgi:hypothetical protein
MRRALPIAAIIALTAQLSAVGASHLFCRMTGTVVDGCGCADEDSSTEGAQLKDSCCDELKTAQADLAAIVRPPQSAPSYTAIPLPSAPPPMELAASRVGVVSVPSTEPPRLTPLYVLERQLLI